MKIVACMPAYKIMDVLAVQSLVAFQCDIYSQNDKVQILFCNNYTASKGRDILFRVATEQFKDADYLISLDSDHVYSAKAMYALIEKMEANGLDILSAKYYCRNDFGQDGRRKVAMIKYRGDKGEFDLHEPPDGETGLIEMDVVGLGFCVMKMGFIRQMVEKYGDLFTTNENGNYADDVIFCGYVKKENKKICYDADTIVGHISTIINK
jgi:hypothetical protein